MATITKQTAASSDYCRYNESSDFGTSISLTNVWQVAGRDYNEFTEEWMLYHGGMRFLNIAIPQGATILSARLKLKCSWSNSVEDVLTQIEGQNSDNPSTFLAGAAGIADYEARPRTVAKVNWDYIPAWTKDVVYSSPDIKAIIQEIVNRPGWASGNSMVIFWNERASSGATTACNREGYSYDGSPAGAPTLEITYEEAAVAPQPLGDGLTWIVA